ncbi:Tfp pilus assembly protein FimT/FimU [Planctomycetota bacterium]
MKTSKRQFGLTLIEILVVVSIIAILVGFGVPAVRALRSSFESESATRTMVEAALGSARALAISRGTDVGIRFQKQFNGSDVNEPQSNDPLTANQYMIFVIHDEEATGYARGFRALDGHKPIRLPDRYGVMDLWTRVGNTATRIADDSHINNDEALVDTTTFTIVFSKEGRLLYQPVLVRQLDDPVLKFQLDAKDVPPYSPGGALGEPGRDRLYVYDRAALNTAFTRDPQNVRVWSEYLQRISDSPLYVSPYTGRLLTAGDKL